MFIATPQSQVQITVAGLPCWMAIAYAVSAKFKCFHFWSIDVLQAPSYECVLQSGSVSNSFLFDISEIHRLLWS